jgi:hypothetical protein
MSKRGLISAVVVTGLMAGGCGEDEPTDRIGTSELSKQEG